MRDSALDIESLGEEGDKDNGQRMDVCSEMNLCLEEDVKAVMASDVEQHRHDDGYVDSNADWYYLFIHNAKVVSVADSLSKAFNIFIHKNIKYLRSKKKIVKVERPTISGLLFVQGEEKDVKTYLSRFFPALHLANDCSTGQTAVIPNYVMQPFITLSMLNPTRIRILMNPIGRYAQRNPLLRITSGPLAGLEGYMVRIDRDRRLVIAVGDMTVAISGVHKETFENLDECIFPI